VSLCAPVLGVYYLVISVFSPHSSIIHSHGKALKYKVSGGRFAFVSRLTSETQIYVMLELDGTGVSDIQTGIGFLLVTSQHFGLFPFLTCFFT
jgi:hypothetical protein